MFQSGHQNTYIKNLLRALKINSKDKFYGCSNLSAAGFLTFIHTLPSVNIYIDKITWLT